MSEFIFTEHRVRLDCREQIEKAKPSMHMLYKKCGINGEQALKHYTGLHADPTEPSSRTRYFFDNISAFCRLVDCSPWDVLYDYYRPYEGPDNDKPYSLYVPTEEERDLRLRSDETLVFRLPVRAEVPRIREYVLQWGVNYFSAMGLIFGTNIISQKILDLAKL